MNTHEHQIRLHFRHQDRAVWIIAAATVAAVLAFCASVAAAGTGGISPPASVTPGAADFATDADAVLSFFRNAFDTLGFQARWQSESWGVAHKWVHIASGLVISAMYLLIGSVLMRIYRLRSDRASAKLFWMFGILFLAGGSTHVLESLMFWWPAYRLTTLVKGVTAIVSVVTVTTFLPTASKVASLRSPVEIEREIVQRRRTELELRQVHAQLEGVIEQRTAELAAKTAEMEQFLNTVSHDLKSPVVTCLGLTGMLREDLRAGKTEESIDTINRIERSATRMRQLIEDLLNLSKIGKIRFDLVDVDTHSMINAIRDEFEPRLAKLGATLDIEPGLPRVRADAHWLTEVFENLITNAMKYGCDNPQPRITVGCVVGEKEHQFYVRDNGAGIDPAHHAQILEPFRRLRTDKEGSGMGLAIVVRIIKMHGGRIWIDSKPGQGATFWVSLPAGGLPQSIEASSVREDEPILSGA